MDLNNNTEPLTIYDQTRLQICAYLMLPFKLLLLLSPLTLLQPVIAQNIMNRLVAFKLTIATNAPSRKPLII